MTDNYLEAASENVMFGGANSSSPANVPADILVENNHFSKRLEWRGDHPAAVKNLFELKSAKRAIIRNNLFERNWTDAQNGYGILFTVRNDDGGAPWSVVEDVLFERNVVRDVENGFNVLGYDSYQPSGRTTRVTIRNNLIVTAGTFLQAGGEVGTLTVDHNTVDQGYTFMMLYSGAVWVAGTSAGAARAVRGRKPHRDQHARQSQRLWVDWRRRGYGHTRIGPAGPQLYLDEQRVGRGKYRHSIPAVHVAADDGGVPGAVQQWL